MSSARKLGNFARSMAQRHFYHRHQIVDLTINDLAFEGKGIAKIDNEQGRYIVFIPNTIPGQKVRVRISKAKKQYAEANLVTVLEKSTLEQEPIYNAIPGAPYINLPLDKQYEYKEKNTLELFRRIGKVENVEELYDEYLPSPRSFHYRNKMEYSFAAVVAEGNELVDGFALGFKKRGQWLAVESLKGDSGIFDTQVENFIPRLEAYFIERGLSAWHGRLQKGFCRMLGVKKSYSQDKLLINFLSSSSELDLFDAEEFTQLFKDEFGDRIGGLIHTVNDDIGDRPNAHEGERTILIGEEQIEESISGLNFKISIESFFQTNPASAERLYKKALDYVFEKEIDDLPYVLDLFSGTGTITQLLAQRAKKAKIIGVELVEQAVEDAKLNAKANGFDDLQFHASDVGHFLLNHPEYQGKINTLTLDPPRAGIAPKTLRKVMRLQAERMVYISCNPATQARDIAILAEFGYKLIKFSLVDQFPHTAHIECVALFERA